MSEKQAKVWGINGGKTGDADILFPKKNCVALGWGKVGNLSRLNAGREFYSLLERIIPDWEYRKRRLEFVL